MTEEMWKDIKGFEGKYQVSSEGRVKSLARKFVDNFGHKQNIKERILKVRTNIQGYKKVTIYDIYGKRKSLSVHRLVCEAFHPNPDNKPEVNHIDEDKSNNRACNLEWVTSKENCNHGTRIERISKTKRKPVAQYTLDGELVRIWESVAEVSRQNGFDSSTISKVARGKEKKAYNHLWKYIISEENNNCETEVKREVKDLSKPVAQLTLNGELLRVYKSTHDAGRQTGFDYRSIGRAALGKRETAYGFRWKYISDKDKARNLESSVSKENNNCWKQKHNVHNKQIAQYTPKGELVKIYESVAEAERQNGFPHSGISKTALGKQKTCKGYIWKYVSGEDEVCKLDLSIPKELCRVTKGKTCSRPVAQYTMDGELIKIFKSAREAERQEGFNHSAISAVALGKQKAHKGYIWKYVSQ